MSDQEEMGVILNAVDKGYTSTLNAAIKTTENFEKATKDATHTMDKQTEAMERQEAEIERLEAKQEALETWGGLLEGAFEKATEGFKKMMEIFHSNLPKLDATVKTADRLGVSMKFAEGLEYGAKKAHVSFKQFELGITGIQTSLSKAEKGNSKAVRAFNDLGLSWKKLQDMSPEQQVKAVAQAISHLPEEKKLGALNSILTGGGTGKLKQSQALMPLFKNGVEGIEKMIEAGERFGVEWDEVTKNAVERSMEAKNQLDNAFEGFEKQLTAGLAPAMADILESFTKWMDKANKMGQVQKIAGEIGEALKIAAGWAKGAAEYIEKIIRGRSTADTTAAIEESQKNSGTDVLNPYTNEVSAIARLREKGGSGWFQGTNFNAYADAGIDIQKQFGNAASPYIQAQAKAYLLARDKFHVNVKSKDGNMDWVELIQEISSQRLEAQSKARTARLGDDQVRREQLGDGAGRESVPEDEKKAKREAEKAAKERARIEKHNTQEQIKYFEKQAREAKQLYRQQEKAETDVKHIQQRKLDLEKTKNEHDASIDRTFHAAQVGTVEGYKALHASSRGDTTSLRQLEQQKKIHEAEVEANRKLDLIHAAIKARNSTPPVPLNLGS